MKRIDAGRYSIKAFVSKNIASCINYFHKYIDLS
jgi:hypothetical protein